MTRYNPRTGARLVNREPRIRPTRERAAAVDGLAVKYGQQERQHDRLEAEDWRLRRQLRAAEDRLSQYRGAWLPWTAVEKRRLQRYRDDLQAQLGKTRAGIRRTERGMRDTRMAAVAEHAAVRTLETECPECGEAVTPAQVDRVKAWTSYRRAWYECECGHEWSART
jgi:hypothetical protein